MLQNLSREFLPFAIEHVVPTHPFGRQVETADAGKQ